MGGEEQDAHSLMCYLLSQVSKELSKTMQSSQGKKLSNWTSNILRCCTLRFYYISGLVSPRPCFGHRHCSWIIIRKQFAPHPFAEVGLKSRSILACSFFCGLKQPLSLMKTIKCIFSIPSSPPAISLFSCRTTCLRWHPSSAAFHGAPFLPNQVSTCPTGSHNLAPACLPSLLPYCTHSSALRGVLTTLKLCPMLSQPLFTGGPSPWNVVFLHTSA